MKPVWIAAGILLLPLAVAGIFLPLLPATPLLLLSAFCFDRGSPRLHAWLIGHPRLGKPIRDWREHRAISRSAKIAACGMMLFALAMSLAMTVALWVLATQILIFCCVSLFILTRPSGPPSA